MKRFYTILVVAGLMVSNLAMAADEQEKPFLSLQNINTLLTAGINYAAFCAGGYVFETEKGNEYKRGFSDCKKYVCEEMCSAYESKAYKSILTSKLMQVSSDNYLKKQKMLRGIACITPLYFGGVLAYSKYKESKSQLKSNQ